MTNYLDSIEELKGWIQEEFDDCEITNAESPNDEEQYKFTIKAKSKIYHLEVSLDAIDARDYHKMAWGSPFRALKENPNKTIVVEEGEHYIKGLE